MYSWLQAAQDFREKQDRKNNENLRKSYRIRLGGKKSLEFFEMVNTLKSLSAFLFIFIYSSSSAETKPFNVANAFYRLSLKTALKFSAIFKIFFCEMLMTPRFAKVYYFLLGMKSNVFFLLLRLTISVFTEEPLFTYS